MRVSPTVRGRLDGAFEEGAGDVGIGDRGGGAEVEHRGQVQRVGPHRECFLQDAVAAICPSWTPRSSRCQLR